MTSLPSVSNSITIRLELPGRATAVSELSSVVEHAGALLTGIDITRSHADRMQIDLTASTRDGDHADDLVAEIKKIEGLTVLKVSDRTFLAHLGGKIEITPKSPIRNRDDLSMIYTPGVARVCLAIADHPEDARRLTIKRNTVAVVTDGTAVLGLGNIGPLAAMPVMEGKAALFKRFAGIDAFPLCLDTTDADEIVAVVKAVAPGFAGINLEDISAPRCFEIEKRLRAELDIPVFHDDQHGTAVVALAALRNALRVVGKELRDVRVVQSGAGAAGSAIARLLLHAGATDLVVCDVNGVVHEGRTDIEPGSDLAWLAEHTNRRGMTGTLKGAIADADVFIGVSAPRILDGDDIATMRKDAIVFAMANPEPEVDPVEASKYATVVATGRSDFANQINNVLVFPGIFRGLLDAAAKDFDEEVLVAAAGALADVVDRDELNPAYIIPSVFHPDIAKVIAQAVKDAVLARRDAVTPPEAAQALTS